VIYRSEYQPSSSLVPLPSVRAAERRDHLAHRARMTAATPPAPYAPCCPLLDLAGQRVVVEQAVLKSSIACPSVDSLEVAIHHDIRRPCSSATGRA